MPAKLRSPRIPSYWFHKSTNRAVVTLHGRDIFLGRYGTLEGRRKYDRVIYEWLGPGRQLPVADGDLGDLAQSSGHDVEPEDNLRLRILESTLIEHSAPPGLS
jgi:hypothetical protein